MAHEPNHQPITRRGLFRGVTAALGAAALDQLGGVARAGSATGLHFRPRAKRVIYLCQSGGPSHLDLFDFKPRLAREHGEELPASVMGTQRLSTMTSDQDRFRVTQPVGQLRRHGESGRWVSDLLPHTASVADELCFIKSMHTEAINHDPGVTMLCTGSQQVGHASIGSWISYGLGSENDELPAFLVLVSQGTGKVPGQPIFSRLWGSGYLPGRHQGVRLRGGDDPVLYLENPRGVSRETRRRMLDTLGKLHTLQEERSGDREIATWTAQHELAFRMQASVPGLADLSDESSSSIAMYGPDATTPGTYAANCLLARRLIERGVRFVQLFHRGWDQHLNLSKNLVNQCRDTDQPSAALVRDLKQRGLLDDTLVVWCGEFGRTAFSQGRLGSGRDHHGRCFTMWMAGGGTKPAHEHGRTDDYGYNIVADPVHISDLNATILHCLGIDHERLIYPYNGLENRLTGPGYASVVEGVLS